MARVRSNIDEIIVFLRGLPRVLDPARETGTGNVAERLARPLRDGLAARVAARITSDGSPMEPNRGEYGRRKRALGIEVGTGLDDGQPRMFDDDQVRGRIDLRDDGFDLSFGLSDEINARAGWFDVGSESDDEGVEPSGARGQPARHFLEPTEEDIDACYQEAEKIFDEYMK